MTEVERILRSFSAAERELWHARFGEFPIASERLVIPEWYVRPGAVAIAANDLRPGMGDPNRLRDPELERFVEREKMRRRKVKAVRAA